MHPISDKELDKLFQQKFEHAEFKPSEGIWGKIAEQMDQPAKRKKKPFPIFWMAAASAVFVVGAALLLNSPDEVIKLQGTPDYAGLSETEESFNSEQVQSNPGAENNVRMEKTGGAQLKAAQFTPIRTVESQDPKAAEPGQETIILASNTRGAVKEPVKQEEEMFIPELYTGDLSKLDVTQNNMIARVEDYNYQAGEEAEAEVNGRRKRSIGSLVNYVVSKVDKRDNKIIEFKDSDEGSEVSGINLGPIKFKSKK